MKILADASYNEEDFRPEPFNNFTAEQLIDQIYEALYEKYSRRFKKLEIGFDSLHIDDTCVKATFSLHNGPRLLGSQDFEFEVYSDYWDRSDYDSHRDRTVNKFVEDFFK